MEQQRPPQQKAAKVAPPPEPEIIEVDLTGAYTMIGVLTITTAGLAGATAWLWRKTRVNAEYLEAIREYVSHLVKDTECGEKAYQVIVDGATDDDVVDWSDHTPGVDDEFDVEEEELDRSEGGNNAGAEVRVPSGADGEATQPDPAQEPQGAGERGLRGAAGQGDTGHRQAAREEEGGDRGEVQGRSEPGGGEGEADPGETGG